MKPEVGVDFATYSQPLPRTQNGRSLRDRQPFPRRGELLAARNGRLIFGYVVFAYPRLIIAAASSSKGVIFNQFSYTTRRRVIGSSRIITNK